MTSANETPRDGFLERIVQRVVHGRTTYDSIAYWEARAARAGQTSVMWPNAAFNEILDRDEWRIIEERLPSSRASVLDLGCGVGRMSRRLATRFDAYTGIDLAPMVEKAKEENPELASRYVAATVNDYAYPASSFDLVLSIACLPFVCTADSLEVVARRIVESVRPGGRVLLIEPFHKGRLLSRGCRASAADVIEVFERSGTRLSSWTGIVFVPTRFVVSERPFARFPRLTSFVYEAGEALVKVSPRHLGDYSVIALDRPPAHRPSAIRYT